ncbi:Protein of unknown function [Rhizobiales bacterium GAS191]|jgi:hypothetical protein|nr:Protein of unknown function [Rhizobiales bacterium GAS113]SEC02653.1 Protein of unknown function [Rhizobiales bacterium GAS191]SED16544.1 Protein of unknown function [Rhizobiales bacterium GAS188]
MSKLLRWLVCVLCLCGGPLLAPVSAQEPGAKDFLARLYANYAGKAKGIDYTSAASVKRYLTPELGALLNKSLQATKSGDAPDLDGDPFIDAQDWEITELAIAIAEPGPDRATGTVTFKNLGEAKTITLDLKKTKAGWRIDDIHWPDDHGTLRKLLAGK